MNRIRKKMTAEENNRHKQEHRNFLYSNARMIEKVFPTIERIEIAYVNHHQSTVDDTPPVEKVIHFTPQSLDIFEIECLNPECSSFGYDLKNDIYTIIREHKTEYTGERKCEGQESHDHPEQSCEGSLKYTIKVFYK